MVAKDKTYEFNGLVFHIQILKSHLSFLKKYFSLILQILLFIYCENGMYLELSSSKFRVLIDIAVYFGSCALEYYVFSSFSLN